MYPQQNDQNNSVPPAPQPFQSPQQPAPPAPSSYPPLSTPPSHSKKGLLIIIAVVVAVLAIGGVGWWLISQGSSRQPASTGTGSSSSQNTTAEKKITVNKKLVTNDGIEVLVKSVTYNPALVKDMPAYETDKYQYVLLDVSLTNVTGEYTLIGFGIDLFQGDEFGVEVSALDDLTSLVSNDSPAEGETISGTMIFELRKGRGTGDFVVERESVTDDGTKASITLPQ